MSMLLGKHSDTDWRSYLRCQKQSQFDKKCFGHGVSFQDYSMLTRLSLLLLRGSPIISLVQRWSELQCFRSITPVGKIISHISAEGATLRQACISLLRHVLHKALAELCVDLPSADFLHWSIIHKQNQSYSLFHLHHLCILFSPLETLQPLQLVNTGEPRASRASRASPTRTF